MAEALVKYLWNYPKEKVNELWMKMDSRIVLIKSLKWSGIIGELGLLVLQSYLTNVWKLSFTHAAGILNIWSGIYQILPIFFLFLVDAYLGHFMMLVLSSVAYTLGIGFISMSVPQILSSFFTGTCKQDEPSCIGHTQKCLFYIGMALVAVGISGHRVSLDPFLAEQKPTLDMDPSVEEQNPTVDMDPSVEEKNPTLDMDSSVEKQNPTLDMDHSVEEQNPTLFNFKSKNWKLLILKQITIGLLVPIVGTLVLPLSEFWWVCFGIPAICIAIATLLFFSRSRAYNKKKKQQGSPLTNVCRVFVACAFNICQPAPIYEEEDDDQERQSFSRTRYLRWLEKATIDTSPENPQVKSRWKHCSLTEVEEAKTAVRMVPIWMISIICGVVSSVGNTYFFEQANHLSRQIGKIEVPLPVMLLFLTGVRNYFNEIPIVGSYIDMMFSFYGPTIWVVGALTYSPICCMAAAGVEARRLGVIKKHELLDKPDEDIPMSIFWLVFQFLLLGIVESCFEKGMSTFYSSETPESMKNYIVCFRKGVNGLGFMFSVFLVYVVGKVSERGGKPNWFEFTLNRSRLDRYYWTLAALSSLNLLLFMAVSLHYYYAKGLVEGTKQKWVMMRGRFVLV